MSNLAEEPSSTERLMNALITKMEGMDGDLQLLKAENKRLRALYSNPGCAFSIRCSRAAAFSSNFVAS